MIRDSRVVITGIGAVSACGWTSQDLHDGLLSPRPSIRKPERFDVSRHRTSLAGEVPPVPASIVEKITEWKTLSRSDQFAVAAAIEAIEHARLREIPPGVALFFGGSTGGMYECEEYVGRLLGKRDGNPGIRLLASQQINSPADAVARHLKLTGAVQTVSSACASGTLALGMALEELRSGRSDVALAGGSDSLCLLTYAGFNSLRSVDSRACRPFRADRGGLSLGEGAGILVAETLDHALARGAAPLAELVGAGASCDASHMTAPHPDGEGAADAITSALIDAAISPSEVDFVNAHGTGTPQNDISESRALHRVFGERTSSVPVTSNKATIGHLLGSAGAIEAVSTVMALMRGVVYPMPDVGDLDSELDLDIVVGAPRPIPSDAISVSSSFAFGGANAAVVFRGWNQGETA